MKCNLKGCRREIGEEVMCINHIVETNDMIKKKWSDHDIRQAFESGSRAWASETASSYLKELKEKRRIS